MRFVGLDGREINKQVIASDYIREAVYRSSGEQWLYEELSELFPHYDVLEEFPCFGLSARQRLDFLILGPGVKIGFEFDGIQHNEYVPHFHRSRKGHADSIIRDTEKDMWCSANSITLIRISKQDGALLRKLIRERTQ